MFKRLIAFIIDEGGSLGLFADLREASAAAGR